MRQTKIRPPDRQFHRRLRRPNLRPWRSSPKGCSTRETVSLRWKTGRSHRAASDERPRPRRRVSSHCPPRTARLFPYHMTKPHWRFSRSPPSHFLLGLSCHAVPLANHTPFLSAIAFSKPYLSTAQAVPVCEDVAFRVDTVLSGNVVQLEADAEKTRLCSVAAGKVRVRIGDEAEFVVGPHGLFKVKAGVACTIRNALYLDAVLHTTVLLGYT